ncbi:MAG TPA: LysR family transcriptional regulator [Leeuwenhoekiella sp.]|nr:LysR family transcriptional regulator [Leeuwenhoekiella sp.]
MFDYKLHVFFTVASRLSFSKGAEELHITQPAVTRHIKQMEQHFNQRLFERKGNSISLTKAGSVLLEHTKEIMARHTALQFDMNALADKTEGVLKIAASTTIAQYILPEVLAKFHQKYPKVKVALFNANTEGVERAIISDDAILGFIEGSSKNREIAYQPFLNDEIVLVVAQGHDLYNSDTLPIEDLPNYPLVLRETGSGTLEVIMDALAKKNIPFEALNIAMRLGSSESIKSYLTDQHSLAFLSINTILKELKTGALGIVDIDDLSLQRPFYYIKKQGQQSALSTLFIQFIKHHYNILL